MRTLLTALVPGYVQLRNGEKAKGLWFATFLLAVLVAAGVTRWLHSFAGVLSFLVVFLGAIGCAWWDGRRGRVDVAPAPVGVLEGAYLALPLVLVLGLSFESYRAQVLGLQVFRIPAGHDSNAPTLRSRDRFMAEIGPLEPQRGMLVLFRSPEHPDRTWVKRVVGIAGDVVAGGPDGITVNGEPATTEPVAPFGPVRVPAGHAFTLGDNLGDSRDSRAFGPIPNGTITGRPLFVLWSEKWDRIGTTLR